MNNKHFQFLACLVVILFCSVAEYNIDDKKNENFQDFNCNSVEQHIYLCSSYPGDRSILGKYDLVCGNNNRRYYYEKQIKNFIFRVVYRQPQNKRPGKGRYYWYLEKISKCQNDNKDDENNDLNQQNNCHIPQILFKISNSSQYTIPLGEWEKVYKGRDIYPIPNSRRTYHPTCAPSFSKLVNYKCKEPRTCPYSTCSDCFKSCKIDPNIHLEDLEQHKECLESCLKQNKICGSGNIDNQEEISSFLDLWRKYPMNQNIVREEHFTLKIYRRFKNEFMNKLRLIVFGLIGVIFLYVIYCMVRKYKKDK